MPLVKKWQLDELKENLDAQKIKGKEVDDSAIGDGKVLTFKSGSGKIEYETPAGGGDMLKSTYDPNDDGVVKDSDKLEGSTKAEVQDHDPKAHTHTESEITDLDHDADKIKGVAVNDSAKGEGKVLVYHETPDELQYEEQSGGGGALPNQTVLGTSDYQLQSTSFEDVPEMEITVAETGTYLVLFFANWSTSYNTVKFDLYLRIVKNDVEQFQWLSLRHSLGSSVVINLAGSLHTIMELEANDVIKIQGKVYSGNTASNKPATYDYYRREFTIIKIA